jgi:hypothetical protein
MFIVINVKYLIYRVSPLTLCVQTALRRDVLDTTLCDNVFR